mgnify:FL=1
MKKLKILFLVLFTLITTLSYGQILKGTGLVYTNGVPIHTPRTSSESEYAVDVSTGKGDLYLWNRTSNTWKLIPEGIEIADNALVPSSAPAYGQSRFRVNNVPVLYFWTGITWIPLTGNAYTAGTGIDITGNVITNLGDLSNTNEIQYIDTLRLTGTTLEASLFNDGLPLKTVDLSSLSINLYTANGAITDNTRVVSIPGNLIFSNNSASVGERFTVGYDNGISSTNSFNLQEGTGITLSSSENNIFLEGQTSFRDVLSPSALTGNVNNYTGLNGGNVGILSSNGAYSITGIDNGVHGRILFIFNNGSFDLTFENQSVSSSVENRFYMGSAYVLKADTGSAIIMYDTLIPGWRAFKFQGEGGVSSNIYTDNGTTSDNTRTLTITETLNFTGINDLGDPIPFQVNVTGNEPQAQLWDFGTDSLVVGQSDTEIYFKTNTNFLLNSDASLIFQSDSVLFSNTSVENVPTVESILGFRNIGGNPTLKQVVGTQTGHVLVWDEPNQIWELDVVSVGGGDDWGVQYVQTDSSLQGRGLTSNPLTITGYDNASNGQVPSKQTDTLVWITPLLVEVDGSITNEIQQIDTFEIVSNILRNSLSLDGVPFKSVDLTPYLDNTDAQNLTIEGVSAPFTIAISGGTDVDVNSGTGISLSESPANTLVITNSLPDVTVSLTNGGGVGVSGTYPNFTLTATDQSVTNEIQRLDTFEIVSNILRASLLNDGVPFSGVDLSSYLDNTDAQNLGYTAATGDLTITGGTGVTIPVMTSSVRGLTPDGDGSGTDEFLREDGTWAVPPSASTDLTIGGSGPTYTIESSTGTDITVSGVGITLSESPANTLIFTATDASATNEIQQIDTFSISGTTLSASLSSDGVPAKIINLSGAIYSVGSDSTFIKTDGSYFGKRITSNVARGGTTTFQGLGGVLTDTSGIININQGASATKYGINFGGNQPYLIRIKADSRSDDNSDFLITRFFIDSVSTAGDNEVFSMGWNTAVGGGREDGTKASLSIRMEKKFNYSANDTIFELHLGEVYFRNGIGGRRPISAAIGHNANDGGDITFDSDYWTVHDFKTDDTKVQWVFGQVAGKTKGITFIDTASLFFEKPLSGSSIYFRDSLNSLFVNALTLNSSNEVYIGSTNSTTTKFGTTFLKVPSASVLYTADHSNFSIGSSSHKTGLVVYGNNNAALTVKGPNNSTGVVFRPEATEFNIQVSGGASPFYLHNSAPQIGFYMNASGNIGYLTSNPQARQHIYTSGNHTTKMLRVENSTGSNDWFRSIATPNSSITGNPGDVALTSISSFGEYWVKRTGTATNTGWESLIGAIRLTKAVPTTTNATQEIGVITHNEGGRSIFAEVDVNVAASGFAKQKRYYIHLGFSSTSGWNTLIPITEGANSGWSGTNDFNLEMKTNTSGSPSGGIDTLRIRRVAGSTVANANITIRFFGAGVNTSFTETSNTGTSTTTTLYGQGAFTQVGAKAGVRTLAPQQDFHVEGTARITGNSGSPVTFMARDADGDINAVKLGSGFSFSNDTVKYTPTSVNTFYTSNGTVTNRDVEINGPLNFTDVDGDGELNITVGGLAGANHYMTSLENRLEYFDAAGLSTVVADGGGVELSTNDGIDDISLLSSSAVVISADSVEMATIPTTTALKSITGFNSNNTLKQIVGGTDGYVVMWDGPNSQWESQPNLAGGLTLGTADYMFGMNAAGTANEYKQFLGITNQVSITDGVGTKTWSLPQDIHTAATPTFEDLTLTDDLVVNGDINMTGGSVQSLTISGSTASSFSMTGTPFVTIGDGSADPSVVVNGTAANLSFNMTPTLSYIQLGKTSTSGATAATSPIYLTYMNDGAALETGQTLGAMQFKSRGPLSSPETGAEMLVKSTGAWTNLSIPTQYIFRTVPTGSKVLQDRMVINHTGETWFLSGNGTRYYDSNNSNTVNIKPPANDSITSNYSLILPRTTGTNGQVLSVRGDSLLYWQTVSTGGSDGNGIYGGDGSIPVGGSEVSMNTIGKTVRFSMSTGNATTGESILISRTDRDATHRYIVMRGAEDSLRIFRFNNENYIQSYSATLNLATDEQMTLSGDSLELVEGIAETVTKMRFLLGATPGNFVKRIDGNAATIGDGLISDGTDWTVSPVMERTTTTSGAGTLNLGTSTCYVFTGTTTTWTLPTVAGNTNKTYFIKNRGSGAITLNSNAGGNDIYTTTAVNTITINAGESALLWNDGTYFLEMY